MKNARKTVKALTGQTVKREIHEHITNYMNKVATYHQNKNDPKVAFPSDFEKNYIHSRKSQALKLHAHIDALMQLLE